MWTITTLLALCVGAPPSRSAPGDPPSSVSLCDLLSTPQRYDNRIVATKALLQSNEHEVDVFDVDCRSTAADDLSAFIELPTSLRSTRLGERLSKILRHDRTARVEFEAAFYGSGGPYGQEKTRFRFVLHRLISVEEVPKKR
jgi:hypothetical protein